MSDAKKGEEPRAGHTPTQAGADRPPASITEPQLVDPNNPAAGVRVPRGRKARKPSDTVEGGRYVVDAVLDDETGEVVRGRVVNANNETLEEIGAEEEEPEPKSARRHREEK